MSVPEKLLGAGALVMALCCALLPLLGAALGGGLIAGAGTVGTVIGLFVLAAVVYTVTYRRKEQCGQSSPIGAVLERPAARGSAVPVKDTSRSRHR
jgi:hypothetical protein